LSMGIVRSGSRCLGISMAKSADAIAT